jgi:RNA polymerase sigma factor (sigma-70 family)
MGDSEVVASIVAGDSEGLAAAYDKYAADLFGYCQSLLHDQNDAADALQDTFVIAASKLSGLRDPERLRAWLFAVARNECLHRLKSRRAAASLADAPEPADDSVDVSLEAERAETVALVRAAVGGLNDGERDVINQLWHGLEVSEVAAVLGVSRNYAYTLFSRARDQLEASVGVLLVGRAGRRDCATLDSLLGDWDGRLTALLRKRVGRHIDHCQVCSDRRRQELTPALLYGVTPGALLALAELRGGTALTTAGRLAGPPPGVREGVLRPADDPAGHAAGFQAAAGRSTNSFGTSGFPKPAHYGHFGGWQRPQVTLAVAGGTVAAAVAVMALVVVPYLRSAPGSPGGGRMAGAPGVSGAAVPGMVITGGSSMTPTTRAGTAPARTATGSSAAGRTATGGPGARGGSGSVLGSPGSSTSPGPTKSAPAGPGGSTGPASAAAASATTAATSSTTTAATSSTPAVTPTTVTPTTVTPTTGAPTSGSSPSAGTLAVSPTTVLLSPLLGGSLTLTASGGPVSWSVSAPASLLGELTVSPASGTLSAGGTATVTITVSGLLSLDSQLTVEPGGRAVTVVLGLG